ncbi:hypothetical protein SUGI_0282030 [Cryptomeria japonica]|nr:hypothetical protein SUGI_0282030 [Cryptomeria japonica]
MVDAKAPAPDIIRPNTAAQEHLPTTVVQPITPSFSRGNAPRPTVTPRMMPPAPLLALAEPTIKLSSAANFNSPSLPFRISNPK